MKVKLKIDSQWLELEKKSMSKMIRDYKAWEEDTLKKAKDAKDLRDLRDVFYQLGDRWEWDQKTGEWLSSGEPLDTVGLILKMPGLQPSKERYVIYGVMAYSKGLTDQFDHLGDKERIIVERDTNTNRMVCWSTTGHGAMDLFPVSLSSYQSFEHLLNACYLVAAPGDHALRIECPKTTHTIEMFTQRLWKMASGEKDFALREIDVLTTYDIEEALDFKFERYATAVIELEHKWLELSGRTKGRAKEAVIDKNPIHVEKRNKRTLRVIEGLLNIIWFRPPANQVKHVKRVYNDLSTEPIPTEVQRELVPFVGELLYSLNDVFEKAKYLKWKSVVDRKSFHESDIFAGLDISALEKEALAVAIEDILREHTLAYIGYPERATLIGKAMRIILGVAVLPLRLISSFAQKVKHLFGRWLSRSEKKI